MEMCYYLSMCDSKYGVRVDIERVKIEGRVRRGLEIGVFWVSIGGYGKNWKWKMGL